VKQLTTLNQNLGDFNARTSNGDNFIVLDENGHNENNISNYVKKTLPWYYRHCLSMFNEVVWKYVASIFVNVVNTDER